MRDELMLGSDALLRGVDTCDMSERELCAAIVAVVFVLRATPLWKPIGFARALLALWCLARDPRLTPEKVQVVL
jgi:hypothetical protein